LTTLRTRPPAARATATSTTSRRRRSRRISLSRATSTISSQLLLLRRAARSITKALLKIASLSLLTRTTINRRPSIPSCPLRPRARTQPVAASRVTEYCRVLATELAELALKATKIAQIYQQPTVKVGEESTGPYRSSRTRRGQATAYSPARASLMTLTAQAVEKAT